MASAPTQYARDGLLFVPRFLPADEFAAVREDCRRLRGAMKAERGSLAVGRAGRFVDRRSRTHQLLTAAATAQRIARLVGAPLVPSAYPIELRSYRTGASMDWHKDDPLFDTPQCELVLCLDNTSGSRTEWIDAAGEHHAAWTPPNAALLVRAGVSGAAHRVSTLKTGERTILKMVWAVPGSARLDAFYATMDDRLPGLRGDLRKAGPSGKTSRRRRRR